jgi:hypothetical protein
MAENITVYVAGGTLSFTGPADLLARPTDEEVRRRIAESPERPEFDQLHAASQHRLGYIETRVQLEYLCAGGELHTFCRTQGVTVTAHPRPRGRRLR